MESTENTSCCDSKPRHCKSILVWIIGIFLLLAIGCHIAWGYSNYSKRAQVQPDQNLYQVVLLSNDQAFFGKLNNAYGHAPYLTDVYYLKPNTQGATDANGRLLNSQETYNVIKRGSEIHSPTDTIYLNAKNILYWENVGADSLVMKGIKAEKEYRATGKAPENVQVVQPVAEVPTATTEATSSATTTPLIK